MVVVLAERGNIDARIVGQLHRAHLLAVFHHGEIDVGGGDAVPVDAQPVIHHHRRHNPVGNEPRAVPAGHYHRLPRPLRGDPGQVRGLRRSFIAADHLHKLHQDGRIEVVHPHHIAGLADEFRQHGDAHGGGIGGNHRVLPAGSGDPLQGTALDVQPLRHRLDDQLHVLNSLLNHRESLHLALLDAADQGGADLSLGAELVQAGINPGNAPGDKFLLDVAQIYAVSRHQRHLGDAMPHIARADDGHSLQLVQFHLIRLLSLSGQCVNTC